MPKRAGIPDDASVECHLQYIGMGTLICRAARQTGSGTTNEVTPSICAECEAGTIYREIGCDAVSAKIRIFRYAGGSDASIEQLFCSIRKRPTNLDYCRTCGLATAETTRSLLTTTRGLFNDQKFYSAYQDIEAARKAMRDGNPENAVTRSISAVESVMKECHDKLARPPAGSQDITGLWKSTRELLDFAVMDASGATVQLINVLGGLMSSLGALRNSLGDAHGRGAMKPEVSENIAELAVNTACTMSTVILRRYLQLEAKDE